MTFRSVLIGLFISVLIAGSNFYFDEVVRVGNLISSMMPPAVFGTLLLFVFLINPLMNRVRPGSFFSKGELATITALTLVTCSVPHWGVIGSWPTGVMLPHQYSRTIPAWKEADIIKKVPERMLVDISENPDEVLNGFWTGMAEGDTYISFFDVPWSAWFDTIGFWMPIVISCSMALIALGLLIHRQWAHHEHLPYPIMTFAQSILPEQGKVWPSLFHKKAFWVTTAIVLAIFLNNYLKTWWPHVLVELPLNLDFRPLREFFPNLAKYSTGSLFYPKVYFTVIGLAFFFTTEISFSMWIGPLAIGSIFGYLSTMGVPLYSEFGLHSNTTIFMYLGGYTGIFLTAVYTGRHYYKKALLASLGAGKVDPEEKDAIFYMRVFLLAITCFVVQLLMAGLDWFLALPYTLLVVVIFVTVSRVVAETGAFFIGTWLMPGALLMGLLGPQTIGVEAAIIMGMCSMALCAGPGWGVMPFAVQGLKLADSAGVDLKKLGRWMMLTFVLALAVALPVMIYWFYNEGGSTLAGPYRPYTAKLPFEMALAIDQRLNEQGISQLGGSMERIMAINPDWTYATFFGIALFIALLLAVARLRFPWWPLHPIVIFFINSHQVQLMCLSFFIGWCIKVAVTKYGGAKLYQMCKPVMLGLIAGELLGELFPLFITMAYQMITGETRV